MRLASTLLLCLAMPVFAQSRTPVLIDTDIGDAVDDSLALALALSSPELDVRAVTTVIDDVQSKTRLAWKELGVFNRRDIPLAMGASQPLADPVLTTHPREFEILTSADPFPESARQTATRLIVDTLLNSREPLTLVPIGPLTNVALALRSEPRIKDHIRRIVLMGGAYAAARAEYNIHRDPVAAEIVFRSGIPITAVGLDVTEPCKMRPADLDRLRASPSPAARFLSRLIELSQAETGEIYPTLYDPLAVAVVFRPDLIETSAGEVRVSLDPATRGQTKFTPAPGGKTNVGISVAGPAFVDFFMDRLLAASSAKKR